MEPHLTYPAANAMVVAGDTSGDFTLPEPCVDFGFRLSVPQLSEPFVELLSGADLHAVKCIL